MNFYNDFSLSSDYEYISSDDYILLTRILPSADFTKIVRPIDSLWNKTTIFFELNQLNPYQYFESVALPFIVKIELGLEKNMLIKKRNWKIRFSISTSPIPTVIV